MGAGGAGNQRAVRNVFRRSERGLSQTCGSGRLYAPGRAGLHSRHVDLIWPLWTVLDLTPAGRGTDWLPRLQYP